MAGRVLITGATGFVGSHISEVFFEAGYEVRCGARATSNPRWILTLDAQRVPFDLDHPATFTPALEGVSVVVHAAGVTRARRPEDYLRVNAGATGDLARAAREAGVERFVFVSSLAARGPDDLGHPTSAYGESKLEAEKSLHGLDGTMQTVVLRPAAVYGPRDVDLLTLFRMARAGFLVLPSGSGLLQPVYATDVARAALVAAREETGFGPFPIAEDVRYTWQEVLESLRAALGRPIRAVRLPSSVFGLAGSAAEQAAKLAGATPVFDRRRAEDLAVYSWTCDTSGTEKELGWRAGVSLHDGLEATARWYKAAGWL